MRSDEVTGPLLIDGGSEHAVPSIEVFGGEWQLIVGVTAADLRQVGAAQREEPVQHLGVDFRREPRQLLALGVRQEPELARFMTATYSHLAPASWNRVAATLGSFFTYTTRQGWTPTSPANGLERRRLTVERDAHARTRAIGADELVAFLGADHPVRDKTLWWLLYETAARANEALALDVADLDLPRRRAVVVGKGGPGRADRLGDQDRPPSAPPSRRPARWPSVLAHIAPAPARQPALADLDPASGRARPSYRRATQVFKVASGGWTLHQLRHSRLTHLSEQGVQLPLLMTKSRHTSLASLAIYAKSTFDAVAAATAALDPDRRRR